MCSTEETIIIERMVTERERLIPLEISEIDFCFNENGRAHKTNEYDLMEQDHRLVVRRGQKFELNVKLNRDYDPENDGEIVLKFNLESGRGERVPVIVVPVTASDREVDQNYWSASMSTENKTMKITMMSPADAHIGKYALSIESNSMSFSGIFFYMIFNPWCLDDQVYMEDENCRNEYVLAEEGLIWRGHVGQMAPCSWLYGQFSKDILDCVLYILSELADLDSSDMNNPIMVSRALSIAINSDSDSNKCGVLLGQWNEPYTGGTSPLNWMGSEQILQKYYNTKETVRYGQCWVFGGVLATACRALGLPCRVITNFASAHDGNGNLRIEKVNGKGEKVWNFHVWNEVWMKRPDLEDQKYDGWQAVDATPQEQSQADDPKYGGKFACGPVPVYSIKHGELDKSYDGPFVYAAINADVYYYKDSGSGPKVFDCIYKNQVGQYISTKAVGSFRREDVTDTYKFSEHSVENRESFERARSFCKDLSSKDVECIKSDFNDLKFSLDVSKNVTIGQSFSATLTIRNLSSTNNHTTLVKLCCNSISYTGRDSSKVKAEKTEISVSPRCTKTVRLDVSWDDYKESLLSQSTFKIIGTAYVEDADFDYFAETNFQLLKPKINIKVSAVDGNDEMLGVEASFKNPLPLELTNGKFRISGPTLRTIFKSKLENILPGAEVGCKISGIPKINGISSITVKFDSNELQGVDGFLPIDISNLSSAPKTRFTSTWSWRSFSSRIGETLDTVLRNLHQ